MVLLIQPYKESHLTLTRFAIGYIHGPADFLKAIGRESEKKLQIHEWDQLWQTDRIAMKKAGLGVKDRRCAHNYIPF